MLKAENITYRYHRNQPYILDDVSLSVADGEIVGLSGPSGRGKTTLAKILAGYLQPLSGTVTLDGMPLPSKVCNPVQLIFQHPELAINPRWRIRQVLSEAQSPNNDYLHRLSLDTAWLDRYPHELSGGELQRVAVARVLNENTRYFIADEMTAMLDAVTQAQIWDAVLEHARTYNMSILMISHDDALLETICDRVILI